MYGGHGYGMSSSNALSVAPWPAGALARGGLARRSGATSAGSAPLVGCGRSGEEDESRWGEVGGAAWGRGRSAALPSAAPARGAGAASARSSPPVCCRDDGGGGEVVRCVSGTALGVPLNNWEIPT
jgi:hypothetical protein